MENNAINEECEVQVSSTTAKKDEASQIVQICSDGKISTDSKNTQVRVVRGTKKVKIDASDSNNCEKKGLYLI